MSSEPQPGDDFAGYRIDAEAGAGGMGVVFRATHRLLGRTVALKLIAPSLARNPAFRARFEREWRMLAGLDHPNVIGIYEAGEVDGRPYLSMRWVAGGDLAGRLRGTAGLEPRVALEILGQVAAALDAAHERGVVHRDIKPANVLLEDERVWLTDFGAGKDLEARETQTATGQWLGTVDYVAPELLDGATASPRSDVYSLGCVLFEALTGRVPFPRESEVATLWAHRFEPPPSTSEVRPSLPKALDEVLRRALAKQPDERPASAGELIRAARAATAVPPPGAPTHVPDAAPAPISPGRRRLLLAGSAGAALVLLAAGVVAGLMLGGPSQTPTTPARSVAKAPFVERVSLGSGVTTGRLAVDSGRVYVGDAVHKRIIVVIASSRQVYKRIKLRYPPHDLGLSQDGKHLWVTLEDGWLADIELATWKPTYARADIDGRRLAVTFKDVIVLSTSDDGGKLQRINPKTHRPIGKPVKYGGAPTDLDPNADSSIELIAFPPTLTFWNERLEEPPTEVEVPTDGVPVDVFKAADAWVTDVEYNTLVRFDSIDGKLIAKIPMPLKPTGIAEDGDILWVASKSGSVQRVSQKTNKKVGPEIETGPLTGEIDALLGVAWATGPSYLVRIESREPTTG